MAFISFILAVFPIVMIHEFAHFLVGKYLGAKPVEFAVGFGKSIFSFRWLDANFKIGWIPLGGYVKFEKVQFDGEIGEDGKKTTEGNKIAPWRWFFISIAGPASNFILTGIIFFGLMNMSFNSIEKTIVEQSTLKEVVAGDKLLYVPPSAYSKFVLKSILGSDGSTNYFVSRNGEVIPLKIAENQIKEQVTTKPVVEKESNVLKSILASSSMLYSSFIGTTKAIVGLVSPDGYKQMMGPIGIAGEANKARESGILSFVLLVASLSFAVGYFNLLPLAFLDGGRALLALFEQTTKIQIKTSVLAHLNMFGFVVIMSLMAMGFFSDFMRMFNK